MKDLVVEGVVRPIDNVSRKSFFLCGAAAVAILSGGS